MRQQAGPSVLCSYFGACDWGLQHRFCLCVPVGERVAVGVGMTVLVRNAVAMLAAVLAIGRHILL